MIDREKEGMEEMSTQDSIAEDVATYDSIEDYTADVIKAREAYAADRERE